MVYECLHRDNNPNVRKEIKHIDDFVIPRVSFNPIFQIFIFLKGRLWNDNDNKTANNSANYVNDNFYYQHDNNNDHNDNWDHYNIDEIQRQRSNWSSR